MAEEVGNFPHGYQVNPSALRVLEQSREEVGRPRRLEDGEEDLRNPGRAREAAAEEERDVSLSDRIEDRVEITQLDIPEGNVEQIEEVRDPLLEAKENNKLRAPEPSEIRDEPDATAIETERGQNVSSLI